MIPFPTLLLFKCSLFFLSRHCAGSERLEAEHLRSRVLRGRHHGLHRRLLHLLRRQPPRHRREQHHTRGVSNQRAPPDRTFRNFRASKPSFFDSELLLRDSSIGGFFEDLKCEVFGRAVQILTMHTYILFSAFVPTVVKATRTPGPRPTPSALRTREPSPPTKPPPTTRTWTNSAGTTTPSITPSL